MKTLYLVRHGKAASRFEDMSDYERPLTDRGRHDAAEMVVRLTNRTVMPSVILASPAPRAHETARILAKGLGYRTKDIRTRKSFYDQPDNALMDAIRNIDDEHASAMLVGHDLAMSDFVLELSGDTKIDLPTCGIAAISLPVDSWGAVKSATGTVLWFEDPKRPPAKPKPKEVRKALTDELVERIEGAVEDLSITKSKKVHKTVAKAAKTLAKNIIAKTLKKKK